MKKPVLIAVAMMVLTFTKVVTDDTTSTCLSGMSVINSLTQRTNYDKSARPCNDGKPTVVSAGIYIVSINKIQESDMEYDIQIYFRQQWRDDRLTFSFLNMSSDEYLELDQNVIWDKIWKPDPYFENEKVGKIHTIMKTNEVVRLSPDGMVYYSARLTLTLSCPMDFTNFPMDAQVCRIVFLSYSHSIKHLIYQWITNETETSVYSNELTLPQFNIQKLEIGSFLGHYTFGDFSILTLDIHFHRRIAFYLTRNYVPAILITIVSWLSFWLDRHCAPARVSIGITTILTMTTLMIGIGQQDLPAVSYVKALDWYYIGCFIFVFVALMEFAVVNYIDVAHKWHVAKQRHERRTRLAKAGKDKKSKHCDEKYNVVFGMNFDENDSTPSSKQQENNEDDLYFDDFALYSELSDYIDNLVRKIYPLVFIVFNIVYWTYFQNTDLEA